MSWGYFRLKLLEVAAVHFTLLEMTADRMNVVSNAKIKDPFVIIYKIEKIIYCWFYDSDINKQMIEQS